MADQTTMTYGTFSLSPVPLISIERSSAKIRNQEDPVGFTYIMTLTGVATNLGTADPKDFPNTTSDAQAIRAAFGVDGKHLEVKCGATTVLTCRPRVIGVSFSESNDNWAQTIPFTITLEYDVDNSEDNATTQGAPEIEEITEEWNFEFVQDHKYFTWDLSSLANQEPGLDYTASDQNNPFEARVTRTITAVGKLSYEGSGTGEQSGVDGVSTYGAENAIAYITGTYGLSDYNPIKWGHALSGITNLSSGVGDFNVYDHFRTHVVDETEGRISITDNWVVLGNNSGLNGISEEFTVTLTKARLDRNYRVSVEGQIQGYESRTYAASGALTPVTGQAYSAAESGWSVIQDRVFPRAQLVFQQENTPTYLNPSPLNKTIGHQPSRGIITYSYEFDDRLCSFISGSLSEQFTIVDNKPSDVFATLTVLGRQKGPILQEISTFTESTREVTIEAIMPPPTACNTIEDLDLWKPTGDVESLICQFQTQLTGAYDQVFLNTDTENWVPLDGRYSRTVGWTYGTCSGNDLDTDFCS